MSDPLDGKQPTDDQEFNAEPADLADRDDVDVQPEDADKVKGGRLEDPCAGGQIRNR